MQIGGEMTVEKQLEAKAGEVGKKYGFQSYKIAAVSRKGLPDRIFIGWGVVIFVEFKSKGEDTTPIQKYVIKELQEHGGTVLVIDSLKGLEDALRKCMERLRGKTH